MKYENVELLKECNSGCKNATNSMEQVLPYVKDEGLRKIIDDYNQKHIKLGDECHKILNEMGEDEKDPNAFTQAMAAFGTDLKLMMNDGTDKIAELMVDGCNMGIKSLSKAINKYKGAENKARDKAVEIINIEQDFMKELLGYL